MLYAIYLCHIRYLYAVLCIANLLPGNNRGGQPGRVKGQGSRVRVQGSGFMVQGSGFRVGITVSVPVGMRVVRGFGWGVGEFGWRVRLEGWRVGEFGWGSVRVG